MKQVPRNPPFTPSTDLHITAKSSCLQNGRGSLTSTTTSSLRFALCKMRDHRSNCVLRITPLKLMDLLWSLIPELSSANLVSVEKEKYLSRNEIRSVECDMFCTEKNLAPLCHFCMSLSCPPQLSRRCWAGSPRARQQSGGCHLC